MLVVGQAAVDEHKGMFQPTPETSKSLDWTPVDGPTFVAANAGTKLPAIVEFVRDGASMRVILPTTMNIINFNLTGVQCPRLNPPPAVSKDDDTLPPPGPAPFSREAKNFTELRVLHRDIHVILEGTDNYGVRIGC